MKSSLSKDIIRTILKDKKRLLALMVITAIGVMMMCGLKAACDDLRVSADTFFDDQRLHDITIQSTLGLDEDDINALKDLDLIEDVQGIYRETVSVITGDSKVTVAMNTFEDGGIDTPYVHEGNLPTKADEIAVNTTFLKDTGLQLGDRITIIEKLDEEKEDEAEVEEESVADDDEDSIDIDIDTSDLEEEAETPNFIVTEYTITASVTDVRNVTNPDGTISFRNVDNDDYYMFVLPEAVDSEIYTAVNLTVVGAAEISTYSEEYESLINEAINEIKTVVKERREQERYDSVYSEAADKINDAKQTMNDAFDEADEKIADARAELDDGWKELADGEKELADGERKLNKEEKDAKNQIADARAEIADGYAQIADGEAQIAEAKAELDTSYAEVLENEQKLEDGKAEIEDGYEQLEAGYAQLDASQEELEATLAQLVGDDPQTIASRAQVEAGLAQIKQQRAELDENKATLDASLEVINENAATLAEGKAQIEEGYAQIEEQIAQLEASKQKLADGEAELNTKEAEANSEIAKARKKIKDSKQELEDGRKELEDGETKYAENVAEYEDKKSEALEKIADAEAELEDIPEAVWYVQDRNDLSSYANTVSDADCIESIGTVFPIMFLIIAVLISLTTITRMVEEDRGLIGTYQALGFYDREIRRKYMTYSAVACIIGGIVGNIGGFIVLPKILFIIFDTMYIIPKYIVGYSVLFGIGGIILFAGSIVAATFISCENTLREMPAQLMRPKPPKSGSRIFLERIPGIWNRMSFLNKVTARNLFRYKKRFLMTVIGIAGCTGLMICGFSVKDTVTDLMPKQYSSVVNYDLLIVNRGEDDNDSMLKKLDEYPVDDQINFQIGSVKLTSETGESVTAQMYVADSMEDLSKFIYINDLEGNPVEIESGKAYITRNASRVIVFDEGDTVTIQDTKLNVANIEAGSVIQNYLGNTVFLTRDTYEKYFDEYEPNAALVMLDESADEALIADEIGGEEYIVSATSTQALRDSFKESFKLMNMIIYIVIVLGAALAFVVLFTLSATNISERERELATIKVLGFYDGEVHKYVNKETLILTVIGIVCGIPLGTLLSYSLMMVLKLPAIEYDVSIHNTTYVFAAVLAFVFALIVNQITNKTLNRIDPVEALKSVE